MSTPGIWARRARWANAGRYAAAAVGRRSRAGEEHVAEEPLGVGRQLAAERAAGDGGGQAVELVEEARDRVRALGVELDRLVRARAQEEEAQRLRRQRLDDLVGRGSRVPWRWTSCGRRC